MPDRWRQKQALRATARRVLLLIGLATLLAPMLAACGKKADELEPPGGAAVVHDYPRVYPDPVTDPKP
ncbi:MAG TPA: hypothetical protein VMV79_04420 [Alphaproteobacteria bacterium]|nr:hypothetical protein [Alphaproteobacteria bacterium]